MSDVLISPDASNDTPIQRALLLRLSKPKDDDAYPSTVSSLRNHRLSDIPNEAILELERHGFYRIEDRNDIEASGSVRQDFLIATAAGDAASQDIYDQAASFMAFTAPQLEHLGWSILAELPGRTRLVQADHWYAHLQPDAKQGWFQLELGINIEGEAINLLPILLYLLNEHTERFALEELHAPAQNKEIETHHENPTKTHYAIPIGATRLVAIEKERLKLILSTLLELYDAPFLENNAHLRLRDERKAAIQSLEQNLFDGSMHETASSALSTIPHSISQNAPCHQSISERVHQRGLQATLRDYQVVGVNWLQSLGDHGGGGILADDMGLGKTLQTLAHLLLEHRQPTIDPKPSLIVAPKSLAFNWEREAQKFAPSLKILVIHGPERHQHYANLHQADVIVTTYPTVVRDLTKWTTQCFRWIVLDEAQTIKNPNSQVHQALCALQGQRRLCLSGTPVENHLGELWAQFHFAIPNLLGDSAEFDQCFRKPIERDQSVGRMEALKAQVGPFILRRLKEEVAPELPPKTIMVQSIELEQAQQDLYESIRLSAHKQIHEAVAQKGWERSKIEILSALTRLRQVCCDPALLKMPSANTVFSAKRQALLEMLLTLKLQQRKTLVFSQFTSMLHILEQQFNHAGLSTLCLTGSTKDRGALVDTFQAGKADVFLISLMAGGTGLTLTAADTVVHYDPWWNPAIENQATDRAYRIGQTKPVFVYKMVARGSIEERIVQLQKNKSQISDALFEHSPHDHTDPSKLSASPELIESLVAPLSDASVSTFET